jgi:hypothetical protein
MFNEATAAAQPLSAAACRILRVRTCPPAELAHWRRGPVADRQGLNSCFLRFTDNNVSGTACRNLQVMRLLLINYDSICERFHSHAAYPRWHRPHPKAPVRAGSADRLQVGPTLRNASCTQTATSPSRP